MDQGAAAALLTPNVLSIIGVLYSGEHRARALGAYATVMGLAAVGGQLLGGALIAANPAGLGWRSVFLINIPIGLLALALAPRLVPESRAQTVPRLDGRGTLLVIHQRRLQRIGGAPLLDPSLFGARSFSGGLLAQLGFWCGQASFFVILALYLQQGRGLRPLSAGLVFTILAVAYLAASLTAPTLAARHGRRVITAGALVLATGHLLLLGAVALVGVRGSVAVLAPGLLLVGRARPSRAMVLRLAEELEVPLRERNSLLLAAGYAPVYAERPLDAPEMDTVRQALDKFLRAHEPYPAVVVNRHHELVSANDALNLLLVDVAPELLEPPANGMRVALHPEGMAPRTLNLPEGSAHLLHRVRRQLQITGDPQLRRLYDELAAYPGIVETPPHGEHQPVDIVLPLRLKDPDGDGELAFFSTLSTFGTAVDVTLSELAIEAFYPADARTAMRLLQAISAS